ncbi:MAG: Acg family FMN-binding oxidoreductase [Jatrophihabitantaceae bacterium]
MASTAPDPAAGGSTGQLDRAVVEAAVEVACRAPSIHNTQPWLWVLRAGQLELRADRDRQLRVADPDGHSLLISCGAALHLTELALRGQGWLVRAQRLPDPADPDLLARFVDPCPMAPSALDLRAVEAAERRHSDRRPFIAEQLPDEVIEQLRAAAAGAGVYAHFPMRADEQVNLAVAVSWADRIERDDTAYQAEMQRWLRDREVHSEAEMHAGGVPTTAVPHVEAGHPRRIDVPLRDFEIGVSGRELIAQDVDEHPLIAVLLSEAETPEQHLAAGEAMMRLMLRAQELGIASCPLSQAVDLVAFRGRVQTLMGWTGYPQMMLRLGYPTPSADTPPPTPRRPLADVLREEPAGRSGG